MDDKLTPMEAEVMDMPEPAAAAALPVGVYGTAAAQQPKRDHRPLWIIGGLLVIAICTMSVIAAVLEVRLEKDSFGKWMLTAANAAEETPAANGDPQNLTLSADSTPDRAATAEAAPDTELSLRRGRESGREEALKTVYARAAKSVVCLELGAYYGSRTVTGVIISEDGYLLTAADDLRSALSVTAVLSDDTEYPAVVVGEDTLTGVAVLKIEAQGLTPAEFGESGSLSVGDTTLCIGNPYGTQLRGVLHEGIVSALGTETVEGQELSLLQSSADFGAGNSGCPVYDRAGHIVAMTSPVGKRMTRDGSDPCFAVCAANLERIVASVMERQAQNAVWVQVEAEEIPAVYLKYFGYPGTLWVSSIEEGSVASELLCLWDVIVAVDGVEVNTPEDFRAAIACHAPNETVELTIYRGGRWYAATLPVTEK